MLFVFKSHSFDFSAAKEHKKQELTENILFKFEKYLFT